MFISRIVKRDSSNPLTPYDTPGFRLEKPKFWDCKGRDLEAEHLRMVERIMGEVDDKARVRAKMYAASHVNCKRKHVSWHGSLTFIFPQTTRLAAIKLWYHGNPHGGKILDIKKRGKCNYCDKPACGWRNRKPTPEEAGRGIQSVSETACVNHVGRER